ncbi:MAG: hypothetical protein O3B01_06790 [Planctomycetota bacterium]|nr:hypothetical protein [Planctomycetota bacterium]MDA1138273.1 hypothetical protein [Planctomycetota bacterium]
MSASLILSLTLSSISYAQPIQFESRSPHALKTRVRIIDAGLKYLDENQNSDGSWGNEQRNLQTSLTILAHLSSGITPSHTERGPALTKAFKWLFAHASEDGFAGDMEHPHMSHAVVGLMCASLMGMQTDAEENIETAVQADRILDFSLRIQNRANSPDYFGGWTPNPKVKVNDRLVTAWQLCFLKTMEYAGRDISQRSKSRALNFLMASQKVPGETKQKFDKEDIGGFSYEVAGLPVVSTTSAGLAVMNLFKQSEAKCTLAAQWLRAHPPLWYGPNFFQTHFFGVRGALHQARLTNEPKVYDWYFRRLLNILKEQQNADGSFEIPPGNAENTKVMGSTYSTAMTVLILNADRELLPLDMKP